MRPTKDVRGTLGTDPHRLLYDGIRDGTIPRLRDLAEDLASRGEDVTELLRSVDGLEAALRSIEASEESERRGRVEVPG